MLDVLQAILEALLKLIKAILEALLDFARWLWGAFPPKRKPWCAVLYFVAQEDATLSYPETDLDVKLQEAVDAVRAATDGRTDLHVVYRAVWAEYGRDPVAEVVAFLGQQTDYFESCSPALTQPIDTGRDMFCFLDWVYRWCPADHYAVFFWGHSFGPAGLFEPGGTISLPQPGLPFLQRAFEQFNAERAADPPDPGKRPSAPPPGSDLQNALNQTAAGNPRIDVVLFQDCWMSTLETAYELRDVVTFLIASQSLVPIGIGHPAFVWPYANLFNALANPNFAQKMLVELQNFYNANLSTVPTVATVPYALIDAPAINTITAPVQTLLSAIDAVLPPATNLVPRETLFLNGQIATFNLSGSLTAGDSALVDVPQLCRALRAHPDPGIAAAASALDPLVSNPPLVRGTFESLGSAAAPLGFGGLSALYRPLRANRVDKFITDALFDMSYHALRFPSDTGWPGTEQPR